MAIQSKEYELDVAEEKITFKVNMLPATRSQEVLLKLGNIIGGGLVGKDFGAIVGEILRNLTSKDLEWLQKTLIYDAGTLMNDKPFNKPLFDVTFAGELTAAYKLLYFALELNFKDFTTGLGMLAAGLKGKLSSFGISNTSFGRSTESSSKVPDTAP